MVLLLILTGGHIMSNQVEVSYAKHYAANVFHLSQQKGARLQPYCRQEIQNVEQDFYDRIGAVEAMEKIGRQVDVIYADTPHSRRRVVAKPYYYSDTADKDDKLKMLIDPESAYSQAAVFSLGRKKDDVFISAALGTAWGGTDGSDAIVLPTSQKIAAHDGSTATGVNLNVKTLRKVKEKFHANDVDDSEKLYIAVGSSQINSMLGQLEVQSVDYNSVKALVMGEVDTFMGFKFIRTERLPRSASNVTYTVTNGTVGAGAGTITAANSRRCIAWAEQGVLFAAANSMFASIDKLPQKHFLNQIYVSQQFGATRMEEEKVVEVICSE